MDRTMLRKNFEGYSPEKQGKICSQRRSDVITGEIRKMKDAENRSIQIGHRQTILKEIKGLSDLQVVMYLRNFNKKHRNRL